MRILHLSTFDLQGGAARAAYRLHLALRSAGVDSLFLVQQKTGDHPSVLRPRGALSRVSPRFAAPVDALPLSFYPRRRHNGWSTSWFPTSLFKEVARLRPDIVQIHWTGYGFLSLSDPARFGKPLVLTLHDMWGFTGGCHYDMGCGGYRSGCGSCPQLGSDRPWDLSRLTWTRKLRLYRRMKLAVACPSRWMAECARSSPLFSGRSIEVLPYTLDLQSFRPIPQHQARELLRLPREGRLILFGASRSTSDPRKGIQFLRPALEHLKAKGGPVPAGLLIFGASGEEGAEPHPFPVHYLGAVHDDTTLALAYSAADVFVAPSTQDNLPNTVIEAQACGTPCVAFRIGGMPDMIEHQVNGYLAEPFDTASLGEGLAWVLERSASGLLRQANRARAEQAFDAERVTQGYQRLFEGLLANASIDVNS